MLTSELHFKRIFCKVFFNGHTPCISSLRDFFCLCQFLMNLLHGLWSLQIGKAGRVGDGNLRRRRLKMDRMGANRARDTANKKDNAVWEGNQEESEFSPYYGILKPGVSRR